MDKDGAIQRFEFTFELVWKVLKDTAYYKGLEVASPRDSLRTAAQLGLIDNLDLWFNFLDARNCASHIYNQGLADAVFEQLPLSVTETEKLCTKLSEI